MKTRLSNTVKAGAAAWSRFWFEFDRPLGLALFRIQLMTVVTWLVVKRQLDSMSWFAADGLVPRDRAIDVMQEVIRPPFAWFLWPDSMNASVHAVLLILCVLILLGVKTRWLAPFAWIIHMGFLQRNYAILFGADIISGLMLFYLMFTRCDERLSVLSRFRGPRRGGAGATTDLVSSAFARLLQIQLGVIYAYTGLEKLKGASWWDGTALWTVLGNPQMVTLNMAWVRSFPAAIAAITFATVVFEIYWPAAILIPRLRRLWLAVGVAFHCGIAALMALWTFSLVMLAPYWLFLTNEEAGRISVSFRNARARFFPNRRTLR